MQTSFYLSFTIFEYIQINNWGLAALLTIEEMTENTNNKIQIFFQHISKRYWLMIERLAKEIMENLLERFRRPMKKLQ